MLLDGEASSRLHYMKNRTNENETPESPQSTADRSVNVITKYHKYVVKVRNATHIRAVVPETFDLESQALELWKISDRRELEDLLEKLRGMELTPELVAMILQTGKSLLKVKDETSRGGKSGKHSPFQKLKDELVLSWEQYTGPLTKSAYAERYYSKWVEMNAQLRKRGEAEIRLPQQGVPKTWLNGKVSARNKV